MPELPRGRLLGGRYRIERELAHGGMATVYLAEDERLGRPVAIKVLSEELARDGAFADRFLAEARTAAAFSHPNLAHVYDSGSDGDIHFIALELLDEHRSLRDLLEVRGRLPAAEAVGIAREVLAALAELHAAGLVHCDVKAGNVMIGAGETKLIDFGIARSARSEAELSTSIGSLQTMAPEQLRGDPLTPATDLFAVGAILYQSLTGRVPFAGDSPSEVEQSQQARRPIRPSAVADGISVGLDDAVLESLELDPVRRFASAGAFSAALEAALDDEPEPFAHEDTTEVIAAAREPAPAPVAARAGAPAREPGRRPPPRRRGSATWALLALPLAVILAVLLLPHAGDGPGGGPSPPRASATATPDARETPAPVGDGVEIPDTIGMSEQDAQALAQQLGLDWTIEWHVDNGHEPGVYAQDPPPGTVVDPGAPFVMKAYRNR